MPWLHNHRRNKGVIIYNSDNEETFEVSVMFFVRRRDFVSVSLMIQLNGGSIERCLETGTKESLDLEGITIGLATQNYHIQDVVALSYSAPRKYRFIK